MNVSGRQPCRITSILKSMSATVCTIGFMCPIYARLKRARKGALHQVRGPGARVALGPNETSWPKNSPVKSMLSSMSTVITRLALKAIRSTLWPAVTSSSMRKAGLLKK